MMSYYKKQAIIMKESICELCNEVKVSSELILHHDDPFNLRLVCRGCHSKIHMRNLPRPKKRKYKRYRCPICGESGVYHKGTHTYTKVDGTKTRYYYPEIDHRDGPRRYKCYLGKNFDENTLEFFFLDDL